MGWRNNNNNNNNNNNINININRDSFRFDQRAARFGAAVPPMYLSTRMRALDVRV
jgi:hypothetical protein